MKPITVGLTSERFPCAESSDDARALRRRCVERDWCGLQHHVAYQSNARCPLLLRLMAVDVQPKRRSGDLGLPEQRHDPATVAETVLMNAASDPVQQQEVQVESRTEAQITIAATVSPRQKIGKK